MILTPMNMDTLPQDCNDHIINGQKRTEQDTT